MIKNKNQLYYGNITKGGDGGPVMIGEANKGRNYPYKGKKRSENACENMRKGWNKFKEDNPNHTFNKSSRFKGHKHTEESKRKISQSLKERNIRIKDEVEQLK